jgi:hypothetical protein
MEKLNSEIEKLEAIEQEKIDAYMEIEDAKLNEQIDELEAILQKEIDDYMDSIDNK